MEQKNGMIVGIFSLVIGVMIVMGMMIPVVSDWTTGERTVNDGAGWLRMNYTTSPSYQGIAADLSGEGVVIYNNSDGTPNGTETLRGTEDTIIYADNNLALWYENDNLFLLGQIDGEPIFVQRDDAISLIRESDGIRVSATDTPTITFPFPTYAYEPNSNGNYAFYSNGTPVSMESGKPNAIVGGGFAGVYAYNNIFRYAGLGLGMDTEYDEDGKLVSASWDKITEEDNTETPESLGAPYIRITHEDDVNDIEPVTFSESGGLRAVPTPTYTDGDWGYEIIQVDGVDKAVIVSWSGTSAGGITLSIPGTVGGYDVYRLGKYAPTSGSAAEVFNNNSFTSGTITNISLPNGLVEIGNGAFSNNPRIGGDLVIPDSVTGIGIYAFRNTRFTTITIGSGVTNINDNNSPFYDSPSITEYIVDANNTVYASYGKMIYTKDYSKLCYCPEAIDVLTFHPSVTTIGKQAFAYCQYSGSLTLPNTITTIGERGFESSHFSGEIVIPDSVTSLGDNAFTSMQWGSNLTLKIGTGISTIPYRAFATSYFTGSLIIPSNVEAIDAYGFNTTRFDTIVIPNTVSSIGRGPITIGNTFKGNSYLNTLIYASDSALNDNDFQNCNNCQYVLDLSDTEDFTQNRRGLPATITVSESIGDCFGYISFTEIGSDPMLTGSTAALLIAIPLLMVVGLTIAAMTVMRGRME